jgi:hypothetical protein
MDSGKFNGKMFLTSITQNFMSGGNISLIVKWIHLLTAGRNDWSNVYIGVEIFQHVMCVILVIVLHWTFSKHQSMIWSLS